MSALSSSEAGFCVVSSSELKSSPVNFFMSLDDIRLQKSENRYNYGMKSKDEQTYILMGHNLYPLHNLSV